MGNIRLLASSLCLAAMLFVLSDDAASNAGDTEVKYKKGRTSNQLWIKVKDPDNIKEWFLWEEKKDGRLVHEETRSFECTTDEDEFTQVAGHLGHTHRVMVVDCQDPPSRERFRLKDPPPADYGKAIPVADPAEESSSMLGAAVDSLSGWAKLLAALLGAILLVAIINLIVVMRK